MKKIILFGGSFDPIHYGHLQMAQSAISQRKADELWFLPTKLSPFKASSSHFKHRVEMIDMMISAYPKMKVSTIEETLSSPSYSLNTVLKLKEVYPNYTFELLIGSDHVESLDQWYEIEQLKTLVQFIVYDRDGIEHSFPTITGRRIDASSSAIRIGTCFKTHKHVLNYMMKNGLYLDEMLRFRLSEYRYEHTLRVCELALSLAKAHKVDEASVYLAAMMHDYCKENYDDVSFTMPKLHQSFKHAFAAASTLSKHYYYRNKVVLKAIQGHVSGHAHSKIGMILYIADKCEPQRAYDTSKIRALAHVDLRQAFKILNDEHQEFLEKRMK